MRIYGVVSRTVLYLILIVPFGGNLLELQTETDYSFLLNQISTERMTDNIRRLSEFRTRYVLTRECNESAIYLFNYFSRLRSFKVSFDHFKLRMWDPEIFLSKRYVGVNVVGSKVESSSRNETMNEYVILCAHYDSISSQPYTSAPGAEDNAAGIAALMEIAQILDAYPLNRTVLFIAFSGEEEGAQGSRAWVSEHGKVLNSTIGIICMDGIGKGDKMGVFYSFYGDLSGDSGELAEFILTTAGNLGYGNLRKHLCLRPGSDDLSFDGKARTVRLWDYDKQYIHTPLDTPATINVDRLKQVVAVTLVATYRLANGPIGEILIPIRVLNKASVKTLVASSLIVIGISTALVVKTGIRKRKEVQEHGKSLL